jgi:type I restriction enzyme S subunit
MSFDKLSYQKGDALSLPKGWVYCQLEDAVKKGSSNISLNKIKGKDGEYPVFAAKGFVQNVSFYHQEEDYLAIIKDGAGIGRVSKHPAKSSVVGTMQYLIPKEGFDIDFIKYFLEGIDFEKHRNGSTIPHIYFKDYKSEKFPKIPLPEQQRIVAILDRAFAAIDKTKANSKRCLSLSKDLFESYLQGVFEKKGDGWEVKTFEELSSRIGDGLHGTPKYDDKGDYYFINGNNLNDGVIEIKENTKKVNKEEFEKHRRELTKNTVLISINGTLGKVAFYNEEPVILGKSACYINFNDQVNKHYIKYLVKSPLFFKNMAINSTGATIKNFSLKSMRNYSLPLPSIEEQNEIVNKLDNISAETQKLEAVYQKKMDDLEELKKSILQKAFAGELETSVSSIAAKYEIDNEISMAAEPTKNQL